MNMQKSYKNNETEKLQAPKSISLKDKNTLISLIIRALTYLVISCLVIAFLWFIGKMAVNTFGYFAPVMGMVIIWLLLIRCIIKIVYIILSTVVTIALLGLILGLI